MIQYSMCMYTNVTMYILFKQLEDSSVCYKEEPLAEEIPSEVAKLCIGREIVRLTPIDCSEETGKHV